MPEYVKLIYDGNTYELPIIVGSEGEKAIDISTLRQKTGLITLDPGFANTGSCVSSITFMNGEKGVLCYRGIPVEQLAEHSIFTETTYLLINGVLPTRKQLNAFSVLLNDNSLIHEDMQSFFQSFPRASHPMGILSSMVTALRSFYPEIKIFEEEINLTVTRLLSKIRTLAAMSYKISRGHKVVYPRPDLSYGANFLNMMFDTPVKPYQIDEDLVKALNVFWILHADHEQNCSTSTVRLVGSAGVNIYAAVSAGINALWGPLHGGANEAVIDMLETIYADDCNIYVRSRRAGERVLASLTSYLQNRLKLKVNAAKSAVDRPWQRRFLGYSLTMHKQPRLKVAPASVQRLRDKLRAAFRRKLRNILWRQWKRSWTRARKLMQYGLDEDRAWRSATNGRGPWWNSGASHLNQVLPKRFFDRCGLVNLQNELRRLQYVS